MKNVTIDGTDYQPVNTEGETLRIVVADNRGLTFVGMCKDPAEIDPACWLTIRDARCVIRWGTTSHIAQLAAEGPSANTRLGVARTVRVRVLSCVFYYDCNVEAWTND